ncbi:MAG: hypothetical protein L0211_01830 [Planctomycetaceae bacterium]|nr:hypothetical protein [Planctomycetaceae bacterium]
MRGLNVDTPVSLWVQEGTPFVEGLALILGPLGLVGDYRYGTLWLTSAAGFDEGDTTGVGQIKPTPGSALAHVWNRPISVEFVETPLPQALGYVSSQVEGKLVIDTTRLPNYLVRAPVTMRFRNQPVQHQLGMMLHGLQCRCRLEDGTLVIEEQPRTPPKPTH